MDPGKLLMNDRLDHSVVSCFFFGGDLRLRSQRIVINIDGERRILQQRRSLEQHIILDAVRSPDLYFDLLVRRSERVIRLPKR